MEIDERVLIGSMVISFIIGATLFGSIGVYFNNQAYNTGYEAGWQAGSIFGYQNGFGNGTIYGNETGWIAGWVEGNSSGYIQGFITAYNEAWDIAYQEGYNDAFEQNHIHMLGNANSTIHIYNSQQNSSYFSQDFEDLNCNEISSIDTYENKTANINATITNIQLFNSTINQHNFTDNYDNYYQANWFTTLYQELYVEHRLNLTSLSIKGRIYDHARIVVSLFNDNQGFVGSLNKVLHTDSVGRVNGIQMIQINLTNIEIQAGKYFIGIDVYNGDGAFTISSSSSINKYLTFCSFFFINELVQVDYAINYTISVPNYSVSSEFINFGILNAYNICKYVEINFVGYIAQIYQFSLSGSIDTSIQWHWYNVTFDIEFDIQFGIDTELSYNSTLSVDAFAVMTNQSTCFWGFSEGDFVDADVIYYTKTDIQAEKFSVIINCYSFSFKLPIPIPLLRGNTYNYNIIEMNATIYNLIGSTWVCNFQMRANLNGTIIYNQINNLYLFEIFRI